MPAGYPSITTKGASIVFTFRFPKFIHAALYDPVLTTGGIDPIVTTNADGSTTVVNTDGSTTVTYINGTTTTTDSVLGGCGAAECSTGRGWRRP
jgi:hypothetical protein